MDGDGTVMQGPQGDFEDGMGSVHKLIEQHGKQAAKEHVKGRHPNLIVEAASAAMLDERMGVVPSFIYSGWCHAGLPHRKNGLADSDVWTIRTDHVTLTVEPGWIEQENTGERSYFGVPYGPTARLILIYLQTRALETGDRQVELGKSLRQFLGRLGLEQGGRTNKAVRDQIERISNCRLTFRLNKDGIRGVSNQSIVETAVFFGEEPNSRQSSMFVDTITLSHGFFENLQRHAVRLDEAAIRKIHNNSRALDVYCWLAFRLPHLEQDIAISWAALRPQFGAGISAERNFRMLFADDLRLALSVYPDANAELTQKGLILRPSPPPLLTKRLRLVQRGGLLPNPSV
jgi:Plasmid encoded RepA protein